MYCCYGCIGIAWPMFGVLGTELVRAVLSILKSKPLLIDDNAILKTDSGYLQCTRY